LFTPSLGCCIAVVFALGTLLKADLRLLTVERFAGFAKEKLSAGHLRLKAVFFILVLMLCIKTVARNKAWKSNAILAATDMPGLANCSRAHFFYANTLAAQLRKAYDPATEAEMIAHYKKSYHISNEAYYAYMALGTYLCNSKKLSEGMAVLDSMLLVYPNQADPNYYMGKACYEVKNYPRAITCLQRSKQLAPAVMITWYFLALAYSAEGDYANALATVAQLKERFGEQPSVYDALGHIYFDKGDLEQSTKSTLELLRFNVPPNQVYGAVIGRYQSKKQDSLAAVYYRQAMEKGVFKNGR
jgi:tetratricopeptide (TPR) repeat protein